MSNSTERRSPPDRDHLDGLPDGCGCAEIWERLSDRRRRATDDP